MQNFRRADGSIDWRRRLEYHTSVATTPQPPPANYANPSPISLSSIKSNLPTPPTCSVPSPPATEESSAEGDDTEVEIEIEQGEGKILSTSEPEQRAKHSLSGSPNSGSEEPLNLKPDNTPPAEPESNTDNHEPESNVNEHQPESNVDDEEPEVSADAHELGLNASEHEPVLTADEHQRVLHAEDHESEFNADTYEPENPEEYDLTEEDLAFFDRPHIPS